MRLDLPIADLLTALVAGGAVVLGVATGVALLRRRGRGDVALAVFLVAASLSVLHEVVTGLELWRLSAHFWITPLLYTFWLGPALAAFVRARVEAGWRPGLRDWPHAVLPAWQLVHEVTTGFAPLSVKEWFYQTPYSAAYAATDAWVFALSFGAYLVVAHRTARAAEGAEGLWLRRLLRGCAAILAVAVGLDAAYLAASDLGPLADWLDLGAAVAYAGLLYWTALTGWAGPPPAPAPDRRETYGISAADLARHVEALRHLVEAERPYLDPALSLGALADRLGLSVKELSYVLNEGLGTGYTDYVNGLRVAEAARRLRDPAHADATVLEVALEAGFASKATFNRAFKKATGTTPTAYRRGERHLTAS